MAAKVGATPWTYSKIAAFETCAKQYYHEKVLKQFPYQETVHTKYGNEYHKAAECYIRDGTPLPAKFSFSLDALDTLNAMPGVKLCEYKFGLTADLEPCDFWDKDVWWRGTVDLLIINAKTEKATVIDYKTGKSAQYADTDQIELMAMATFKNFPKVKQVRGGLLFVVAGKLIKGNYHVDNEPALWAKWLGKFKRLEAAHKNDVWNPSPSGLCRKHCPVTECVHNGNN